jgi:hypothetical protein
MNNEELSKVSEESFRGRCESEGDVDQEIIDGEDDEGVDPNAYGDEVDETEEEREELPPAKKEEKKEHFKWKP